MKLNLQLLSKSQNQTTRHVVQSELKTNSGQSQKPSGVGMPAPVLGISFFGQQKRAEGSTPELEKILQELESFATYDPINGGFRVTRERSSKYPVGSSLGSKKCKGYQNVTLFTAPHDIANLHWLVWLWHTGSWPTYQLDHINQNKLDNRIENLRDAHRSFNSKNTKKRADNTSGHVGVSFCKRTKKWKSYAIHMGKQYDFGYFASVEDAIAARAEAIAAHPEWGFTELHGLTNGESKVCETSPINPYHNLKITLKSK